MCSKSRVDRLDRRGTQRPSYARPHWFVKWVLGFIILSNLAVMILSGFFVNDNYRLQIYGKYRTFVAVMVWLAIPFVALLISIVQGVQSGLGRLGAVSVVVAGVFCSLIWVVYACMGMMIRFDDERWWPWCAFAPSGFFLNIAYLAIGAHAIRVHKSRKTDVEIEQATACMETRHSFETVEAKPPSYAASEITIFPAEEKEAMH